MSAVAIQDLYPAALAHCYGCGRDNPHGHHVKTYWRENAGFARFTPLPHQLSFPGFVYGGLIASLVDCHAIGTAAAERVAAAGGDFALGVVPRYVTGSLAVKFLKPTPIGVELELEARVREAGERKSIVEVKVLAGGAVTATGEVVAVRMPESMRTASHAT